MRRRRRLIRSIVWVILILATLSLAGYGGQRLWMKKTPETSLLTMAIVPKDFTIKISANGEIQAVESITIAVPPVPAERLRISSVVMDGRPVNKGDTLIEFDPTDLDLRSTEYRSNLQIANEKINKSELAVGVEKADIIRDKQVAELELQKINEFLPKDEQIYSRREIVEGQIDKNYAEKRIVFADARLELKGKSYSLSEAILMLERQQANSKVSQVEKALSSLKLLSPKSGIVVHNKPDYYFNFSLMPGRDVRVGMPLFNLVNPDKMEAKCFVLEKDAGELRVGQNVIVRLDPFPEREFTGKIKQIDNLARVLNYYSPVKYFQVVVTLDQTDANIMKPGVKLKAEIFATEVKSAVVLPRSAIVKKEAGYVAYVQKAPNQFEPVAVKLAQGDLIQVVVTEGLQGGQLVALNPPDARQDFLPSSKKTSNNTEDKAKVAQ